MLQWQCAHHLLGNFAVKPMEPQKQLPLALSAIVINPWSGLNNDPAKPYPKSEQDKAAEDKYRKTVHDLVVGHMN